MPGYRGIWWLPSPEVCRMLQQSRTTFHSTFWVVLCRTKCDLGAGGLTGCSWYFVVQAWNLGICELLLWYDWNNVESGLKLHWPFPKQALVFTCLQCESFENTVGKGEIAHVMSNFSFSHSVFHPSGELSTIFIKLKIVFCQLFQFRRI